MEASGETTSPKPDYEFTQRADTESDREFAKTKGAKEETIQPITERFLLSFVTGGGIYDECGCGRKHIFVHNNEGNFDEGELETLEAAKLGYPDRYFFHDYDSSSAGYMNGSRFVMDCQCLERRFGETAKAIWRNRNPVLDFLRRQASAISEELKATQTRLETLPTKILENEPEA